MIRESRGAEHPARGRAAHGGGRPAPPRPSCRSDVEAEVQHVAFLDAVFLAFQAQAAGVAVVRISADSVKSQANFATKYDLTMPLLADPDHVVLEPWGVWGEKKNYGKTYQGIHRTTVWFDAAGAVVRVWENVRVKGHAEAVLEAVRADG